MSKEISISDEIYNDVQKLSQRLGITPEEFINDATKKMVWETMTEEEVIERVNKYARKLILQSILFCMPCRCRHWKVMNGDTAW